MKIVHVLVTGATGNIGRRVLGGLRAAGCRPRAFVRDAAAARALLGDDLELAVGDLEDEASLEAACADIQALFLLTSGPTLAASDERAARAAQARGVGHIVKMSSLGARATGGPATAVALWHARGEQAIRASGVPHTFVRSVGFMSNALAWAPAVKASGVVRASTGDGRIAMVHPDDVAEVAVQALLSGSVEQRAWSVTGPRPLSYAEMAAKLGRAIGRPVLFQAISDETATRTLTASGMPPDLVTALVALWREVREGLVDVVTPDVEKVTGHPPRSFDAWAAENAAAFMAASAGAPATAARPRR